ncbi:MAG: hypothetical protein D8H98_12290 [Prevotella sp.]|nr:MAG: hypothetical protein D8H98_12290 [Prevotella sp.]
MKNKIASLAGALMFCLVALAQSNTTIEGTYRHDDLVQIWRNTDIAAGLTLDSMRNRGFTSMGYTLQEGDYHRVQEGSAQRLLNFYTERYQRIGKWLYGYGSVNFDTGNERERVWSDVYRTYNSNPYFSGSSVPGRYDFQNINLRAVLSTVALGHLRYGLSFEYRLGDLSRQRDPRSRSQLLDYVLTPSVAYTFGDNTLAAAFTYNRRKEKIPNISTVQTDATLLYYTFTGMENAIGTQGGYNGYLRQWVNHELGAQLAYSHRSTALHSLTALGMARATEYVYGNIKFQPGRYHSFRYWLNAQNRIYAGRTIHSIDASAQYLQAYADEYRQQLTIEKDPVTGIASSHYNTILTYKKRYQVNMLNLVAHYRANFTDGQGRMQRYLGLEAGMQNVRNRHLVPFSQLRYRSADVKMEAGSALLRNNSLWVDAYLGAHLSTLADLVLANGDAPYAQHVLLPDMDYYRANAYRGGVSLKYTFPLTVKKMRTTWFVRGFYDRWQTNSHLHRNVFGLSVGLFN